MPIVTDQLAAEYLLREGSGTAALDTSGNGLDGTFGSGSPAWVADGISFTSTSDQILLPDALLANDNTSITDATIEVWVNSSDDTQNGHFVVDLVASTYVVYEHFATFRGAAFNTPFLGTVDAGTIAASDWHHIVLVRSGSDFTMYQDGVMYDSNAGRSTTPFDFRSSNGNKCIGGDTANGDPSFLGTIGEVRFYSKGLSSAEVTQNYTASSPRYAGSTAPTVSFTATPSTIPAGPSSTLSWTVGGSPTSVSIDNGIGSVAASDSIDVSPSVTTIYTLTATNDFGTTIETVTVTVSGVEYREILIAGGPLNISIVTCKLISDGDKLWAYGMLPYVQSIHSLNPCPGVFLSEDGGLTWTLQDYSNASNNYSGDNIIGGVTHYYHAYTRTIWFGYYHYPTLDGGTNPMTSAPTSSSFFEFQTFSIDTATYSSVFGSAGNTTGLSFLDGRQFYIDGHVEAWSRQVSNFVVFDSGEVLLFYSSSPNPDSSMSPPHFYNEQDVQLYYSRYGGSGTSWASIDTLLSDNCPTGIQAGVLSVLSEADYLGGVVVGSTLYFFYQNIGAANSASGTFTEAIYFRTLSSSGTQGSAVTLVGEDAISVSVVRTEYQPYVSADNLAEPTGSSGINVFSSYTGLPYGIKTWVSFANVYISGSTLYASVSYRDPGSGDLSSALLAGTPLSSPSFSYTQVSTPVAPVTPGQYTIGTAIDRGIFIGEPAPDGDSNHPDCNIAEFSTDLSSPLVVHRDQTIKHPFPVFPNIGPGAGVLCGCFWDVSATYFLLPYGSGSSFGSPFRIIVDLYGTTQLSALEPAGTPLAVIT